MTPADPTETLDAHLTTARWQYATARRELDALLWQGQTGPELADLRATVARGRRHLAQHGEAPPTANKLFDVKHPKALQE